MKPYTVVFERDADEWWVASVRGVAGVHSQGRSIDQARTRVREALALAIGDDAAERARLVDDVRLPKEVKRRLAALAATKLLTEQLHLSRRDAAARRTTCETELEATRNPERRRTLQRLGPAGFEPATKRL